MLFPIILYALVFSIALYPVFEKTMYGEFKPALFKCLSAIASMSVLRKLIISASVLIAFSYFLGSLTSPFGGQGNDVLRYHLTTLKEFIRCRGFVYMPDVLHSNSPFAVDILFLPGFMLGGALLAQLTGWLLFCLLIISVMGFAKYFLSASSNGQGAVYPEFSAILVSITPLFFRFADTCMVDNGLTLFVVMAMWMFYRFGVSGTLQWIVLGACFLGMAIGTKYTALFMVPALCVAYIVVYRKRLLKRRFCCVLPAIIAAGFLLTGGVWYLKNYIYTNNPVFPAFYDIFGGNEYWTERADRMFTWYIRERGKGMGKNVVSLILSPWNFTMHSAKFHNWQTITPLYLSLSPALFFVARRMAVLPVAISAFLYSILWFYMDQEARFFAPALPLFALLIHSGLEAIFRIYQKVATYVRVLVLLGAVFSMMLAARQLQKNLPVLTGKISNLELQKRNVDYPDAYELINKVLEDDDRVLMLKGSTECGLVRYYVDGDCMVFRNGFPEWCGFSNTLSNPEGFLNELRAKGFTYILDVEGQMENENNRGALWRRYNRDGRIREIGRGDGWKLYRVAEPAMLSPL